MRRLFALLLLACAGAVHAAQFATVEPGQPLAFPADHGAHPAYRTEWWYVTGWLDAGAGKPIGFQVTFFRSATGVGAGNPSAFAPRQLIIGHAALSDPVVGKLQHDQRSAREGFGLAYAKVGDTDVKLDDWRMQREADGSYRIAVAAREFTLALRLACPQTLLPQGDGGYSRKGPRPAQASYYYSQPQLNVAGTLARRGAQPASVNGRAWLDHEWSSSALDPDAAGWDWVGVNLDDGGALMAFQIRGKQGGKIWAHAMMRDAGGHIRQYAPDQVSFGARRHWRSPRTGALYPVAALLTTGASTWQIEPLQDDQELDGRRSTGAVYWEGAATLVRDGVRVGRAYLEMTGYDRDMKL